MPSQPSPRAADRALIVSNRRDPALPLLLEFQSPADAITNAPIPRSARGTTWVVTSMFMAGVVATGVIKVDRVVSAQGQVVSRVPTMVVQPLETSIVSAIDVHVGESVHAGQVLAQLNPTFAAADVSATSAQVAGLQAAVDRYQAELDGKPFNYHGPDRDRSLQVAIYAQREAQYRYQMQTYQQDADSLEEQIAQANSDAVGYRSRLAVAQNVEQMRRDLEHMKVGSRLNTLAAMDDQAEMTRKLAASQEEVISTQRKLAALLATQEAFTQQWHADIADKLAETNSKLSDARAQLNKANLRQELVVMRADRDATVLSVANVSVGSVLHSGEQLMTLVPSNAPLEVTANIAGSDDGYVHIGDSVAIKFATLPFAQYGMAYGTVSVISPDSFTAQEMARHPTNGPDLPLNSTEPFYRARITIDRFALHNVPAGFHLMPGMPVSADVKVGRHSVLQYLLGRVLPTLRNAMREP